MGSQASRGLHSADPLHPQIHPTTSGRFDGGRHLVAVGAFPPRRTRPYGAGFAGPERFLIVDEQYPISAHVPTPRYRRLSCSCCHGVGGEDGFDTPATIVDAGAQGSAEISHPRCHPGQTITPNTRWFAFLDRVRHVHNEFPNRVRDRGRYSPAHRRHVWTRSTAIPVITRYTASSVALLSATAGGCTHAATDDPARRKPSTSAVMSAGQLRLFGRRLVAEQFDGAPDTIADRP